MIITLNFTMYSTCSIFLYAQVYSTCDYVCILGLTLSYISCTAIADLATNKGIAYTCTKHIICAWCVIKPTHTHTYVYWEYMLLLKSQYPWEVIRFLCPAKITFGRECGQHEDLFLFYLSRRSTEPESCLHGLASRE